MTVQTYDKEYVDALIAVYEAAQRAHEHGGYLCDAYDDAGMYEALAAVKTRQKDDE
jgi:hypothetical protein